MKDMAKVCLYASVIAVLLSIWGAAFGDVWLGSTQWVLVAATLGIYAVYFKK